MTKNISEIVRTKFDDGSNDFFWVAEHGVLVGRLAHKMVEKYSGDKSLAAAAQISAYAIHSGIANSDETDYLSHSIKNLNEVFEEKGQKDSEFAKDTIDLMTDSWRGLYGFPIKRRESEILVASELYVRFVSNFFHNANDEFAFDNFRDYRGWIKNHIKIAKTIKFPKQIELSKECYQELRSLYDRSRTHDGIHDGMAEIIPKYTNAKILLE